MTDQMNVTNAGPSAADAVVTAWRVATEQGDVAAATRCLAADVVVISPLNAVFKFTGRDQVQQLVESGFEVLSGVRFHTEVGDGPTRTLVFNADIGREPFEMAQLLRLNDAGLIHEMTLFGRPLPALTALMAGLAPRLLRRQGRPGLGRLLGAATVPLAVLARLGEQRLVPLADPNQPRKRR
jgi:SnoaL-like domain